MVSPESMIKKFSNIQTLPHVAIKLTKLISADEGGSVEYEEVIKHDPSLVIRLFRLVNSAYFSLREKAETISEALVFIGLDNLRNIVVVEALKDIFKGQIDTEYFSRAGLWNHCVATGLCSKMVSERIFGVKGEDAFLCGLLHDIGMIVEDQAEPELFQLMVSSLEEGVRFVDHEKMVIGASHCETGFWLSREWKLPASVQFGIRDHHKKIDQIDPGSITGIVQLSEMLVSKLGHTVFPEVGDDYSESLLTHLSENITEYQQIMKELPVEMEKAKDVYGNLQE